ncbi:ABC transporter substrate-binding protein [Bacteroidota bacterium]
MKKNLYTSLILFVLLISGCTNSETGQGTGTLNGELAYARKFSIDKYAGFTRLTVHDPWQNASNSRFEYYVADSGIVLPDSLQNNLVIRKPVRNVVIMSTTFLPFLDTLGEINSITGISGGNLVFDAALQKRIDNGSVREVGFDQRLNYEVLVDLQPDVVFLFGVQAGIVQTVQKLKEINIPVVLCADYLESHPLGRMEWIKFFSVFYGKEAMAANMFEGTRQRYTALADSLIQQTDKPKVMMGLPWKDIWYVAGGRSFAAALISDAGGEYAFSDLDSKEALPFDIEAVFTRCYDADIWINPGVATSYATILEHDTRFELLLPFKQNKIYANSKRMGERGGNDYWESGILHPDLILKDLAAIFYESAETEDLYYYMKLDQSN